MNPRRVLLIAIFVAAALSFSCLAFPDEAANIYTSIMHPLILLIGFILALRVAQIYEKELKKSFLFLSFFLLLYMLSNILPLWEYLYAVLGYNAVFLVLVLQVVTYAMLITSGVYTVKVIQVRRMNRFGWVCIGLMLPLCVYIVVYEIPHIISLASVDLPLAIARMMVRVLDMAIVLMLLPVVLLYIQHLREKAQESISFTFVMGGLIFSMLSTYVIQLAMRVPLEIIASEYFHTGSILDATIIFGYLLLIAGLYAHRNYDDWGYKMIEKALG